MIGGNRAKQFGRYEALRLWGTAWPILLALGATLLTQLAADVGTDVSATAGVILGLVAKAVQQWAADNRGKTL
jgi:beta-glucosidase-like glycosyl hydrolase